MKVSERRTPKCQDSDARNFKLTSNEGGPDTSGETDPDSVTVRVGVDRRVTIVIVVSD